MARIKPVVGEVNPAVYSASQNANLSPEQRLAVEQLSYTIKKAKELRALKVNDAKREFQSLTEEAQINIKALYPTAKFTQEDPNLLDRSLGVAGKILKGAFSPIIGTLKVAVEYGKSINTPYVGVRQVAQGADPALKQLLPTVGAALVLGQGNPIQGVSLLRKANKLGEGVGIQNPFKGTVWDDAYNGRDAWDKGAISRVKEKYGNENVIVAQGLLQGKTPGEIVEAYGKPDPKILAAITNAFDNEKVFAQIIFDTKAAGISPGRDIYRKVYTANQAESGNLNSRVLSGKYQTAVTGTIDTIYQIVVDPLTYVTGGVGKVGTFATKGQRIADNIMQEASKGNFRGSIKDAFADPGVKKLWDSENGVGPAIRKFAEAQKGSMEKSNAYRELVQNFPGFSNFEVVKLLADKKIFDSQTAESFFGEIENVTILLNGRVDGITFMRNGIPTAQSERQISMGIAKIVDSILNPTVANGKTATDLANAQNKGIDAVTILKTAGEDIDKGVNVAGIGRFADIDKDIKRARRISEIIGKSASRNPAGTQILLGDDAVKTAENFRLVARQVFTRDVADFVTFHFLDSQADEQVIIIRNLYAAVMHRYGLHGTVEGRKIMEEILNRTFNNRSGMTTTSRTEVPSEFVGDVSPHAIRIENDSPIVNARGIVQPSQVAEGIGALPYEQIIQVAAVTRRKNSIPALFDGATRNKYVSEFVNFWTILTLFPRLGIRSAIDEAFMYALNAPLLDLLSLRKIKDVQEFKNVATALTGSTSSVGPIRRGINKVFRKGGAEETLSVGERAQIAADLAFDKKIPIEEVTHLMIREETIRRVYSAFGVDDSITQFKWLKDAFVHHPDVINSMAASISARTSLGGRFDKDIIDAIFTPSTLSMALEEVGVRTGRKFRSLSTEELRRTNDKYLTLAHFDAWYRQFAANKYSLKTGETVDPAAVFFDNNGLKTAKDFSTARTNMLKVLGVEYDFTTRQFYVKNAATVREFLSLFGDSVHYAQRGINNAEIARIHVETMLLDMRNTFHGGPKSFNEDLFNLMATKHNELVAYEMQTGKTVAGKWSKVAGRITFEDFEKVTVGKQPTGEINTSIEFEELLDKADLESMWGKFGNTIMEAMDRQVNGLFRQPAVLTTYSRLRDGYEGLQKEFADKIYRNFVEEGTYKDLIKAREAADTMASKRFTEIAMDDASNMILKYVDNPAIRSNFALSTRTVARFYRATEDFWRRYYRLMREKPLQVIYRMRLAHQGLSARGEVYNDDQGEPYVVLPTDTIINTAVEPVVRQLTGGAFKIPQFNDVTLKLRLINPSFAPDAGQPSLSGPVAALSFLGIKGLLGYIPGKMGDKATNFANDYDSWALGNLGDNMTLRKALMPLFLQNLETIGRGVTARAIDTDEMNRQETTAAFQAIAYIKAFGDESIQLPENATDAQKAEFIKTVKIAAHNVLAARAFFGMISPISPTLRESKGVPDYIKRTGVTNMRAEFYDILAGISRTEGDWLTDPYELAVATFVGKNPRRIIYTVSRNEKATKIAIQKTDTMYKWASNNQSFLKTYGEAAYIFGPQTGDYTADSYTWLEAQGLIKLPSLETYLDNVSIAQAKQAYFDIEREQRKLLDETTAPETRKGINEQATFRRNALKSGYPVLRKALETGGFEVSTEREILSSIEQIILDKSTPVSPQIRKNMGTVVALMREFISFSEDPESRRIWNFTELKRDKKAQVEQVLNDLIKLDPAMREANRAVFAPILGFYSRDTYTTEVR
jgi:hypothetical protein